MANKTLSPAVSAAAVRGRKARRGGTDGRTLQRVV